MATWPAKINYATGDVLTAAQMNDIGGELNDLYTASGAAAGKNKIINGDFGVNQRAFTSTTSNATYTFDRWISNCIDGTTTITSQAFTAGSAPVTGYESTNYLQIASTGQTATNALSAINQRIEDVRAFAGQTVTVSFWAKASSGTPSIAAYFFQAFGAGGSSSVIINGNKTTISTSWARYSFTVSIPSLSGQTVGPNSHLQLRIVTSAGSEHNTSTNSIGIQTATISIWGVQVEAGSVATAFQTATGTIQGELAACQRYAWQIGGTSVMYYGMGQGQLTTQALITMQMPVIMRTTPSVTVSSAADFHLRSANSDTTLSGLTLDVGSPSVVGLSATVASGLTQGRAYNLQANANTTNYILFNAEL